MARRPRILTRLRRTTLTVAVIAVLGGGALYYNSTAAPKTLPRFQTAPIARGDLVSTISATGTLEPEEVVNVGAQVAGLIVAFGTDPHNPSKTVDYNTVVEKDTVLAKIDPTPYEAALEQAQASLAQSEANYLQLEAKARQAERYWKRAEVLLPQKAISASDYDSAISDYEAARANLEVGKAAIRINKATVKTATVNHGYCTIMSPVRGTIIDRRVNIGQTVVASLNAPSLFLIAKDLSKMQVWASVNEGDIGKIYLDMPVRFTVDAHGDQVFTGKVTQVRMNAQMSQNVVTYTVIVTTDNPSGKLLPYLTANAQFEVASKSGVLMVPNAALRWTPASEQIDPMVNSKVYAADAESSGRHWLWVETERGMVRPVEVAVGMSDGMNTEVSSSDIQPGLAVVLGENGASDADSQATTAGSEGETKNPFMPQPPKGSGPPPGPM